MNCRWFQLVPTKGFMKCYNGLYVADLTTCWDAIVRGVKSDLITTESDVEDVASEYGFDVVWCGDEE